MHIWKIQKIMRKEKISYIILPPRDSLYHFGFYLSRPVNGFLSIHPFACVLCSNKIGVVLYILFKFFFFMAAIKRMMFCSIFFATELTDNCIYYRSSILWSTKFLVKKGNWIPTLTLLVVWPWIRYLITLCVSLLISKIGIMMVYLFQRAERIKHINLIWSSQNNAWHIVNAM